MTTALAKYETARRALAEAHRVDEVKDIRNKADAMQRYAMQAKDSELIEMATDIKMRAERRAGELLREMEKAKGTRGQLHGRNSSGAAQKEAPEKSSPKLSDLNITHKESARWQKLAALPEKDFEEKLTGVKSAMRAKTEGNRPKSNGKSKPRAERSPKAIKREEKVAVLNDAGLTAQEIAAQIGLGLRAVHQALEHVEIKREAVAEIDPAALSLSAQEKLAAAMRQHQRKLDADFERRVRDEISKRVNELILPHWKQQIKQAKELFIRRKTFMDKETFNTIRRALHPDSRQSISDNKLGAAFDTFMGLEKYLLNEKDSPTGWPDLPSSAAEWDKMRMKRPSKRTANSSAIRPR